MTADDVAELLRVLAVLLDEVARDPALDPDVVGRLRGRFVAASVAARRDPALARRRLAALDADLRHYVPPRRDG